MYSIVLATMLTASAPTTPAWGCCGCGCYGCGCWGCGGCCGGCWGCGGWGCYGCYGCWGGYGYSWYPAYYPAYYSYPAYYAAPVVVGRAPVVVAPVVAQAVSPTQAQITVELPADAELFVDGKKVTLTASPRTVVTPTLESGKKYVYHFKAEMKRNGKRIVQTKDITFKGGDALRLKIDEPKAETKTAAAN